MPARPSEDEIIARYFAPLAGPAGLGLRDDAAVLAPTPGHEIVVTVDALVAGVHFFADDPPDAVARKALRVNLSDLAAKGADPVGFLLALALPADWTADWLASFAAGLGSDATAFMCPLIGGDTVATPGPLTVSITALGSVPFGRMVPRTGVKPEDRLFVTGTIGDAALGLLARREQLDVLDPPERAFLRGRYMQPEPRLAIRAALRAEAHAGMDISDGLIGDVTKMVAASGLGASIELASVPLSPAVRRAVAARPHLLDVALTGGDDYEILCAVPPDRVARFVREANAAEIAVTAIGVAEEGGAPVFRDSMGAARIFAQRSFSHF